MSIIIPGASNTNGIFVTGHDGDGHGDGHGYNRGNYGYNNGFNGYNNNNFDSHLYDSIHNVDTRVVEQGSDTRDKVSTVDTRVLEQGSNTRDKISNVDTRVLQEGSVTRERLSHFETNVINNLNRSTYDTLLSVEKTAAAGQNATQRVGDSVLVAIERSRAEVALSGQINAAKIELLAAQNFARVELLASQNFSATQAALAECCCELKELVKAEASAGRELARDIEARQVRDELQDAKLALALSKNGPK